MTNYIEERTRALVALDLAWAREQVGGDALATDDILLTSLHKARYECPGIEPALRHASRQWLEMNGHDRLKGMPWPPMGLLEDQHGQFD